MSDTNISQTDLGKLKQSFIKLRGGHKWEERNKESKSALRRLDEHDVKLKWQDRKIDFAFYLMIGVLIVVGFGFLQLLASYYQFVQNSFNDYRSTIDHYNEGRYIKLDTRIQQLEFGGGSTGSAK